MMTADKRVMRLRQLCHDKNLIMYHYGMGHYQIRGGVVLVNYYPFSKGCTMYVDRAPAGVKHASPETVVNTALGILKPENLLRGAEDE